MLDGDATQDDVYEVRERGVGGGGMDAFPRAPAPACPPTPPPPPQPNPQAGVRDVVAHVLSGYNGTVLAYGQTGAGKTHTMTGERGECWGVGREKECEPSLDRLSFPQAPTTPVSPATPTGASHRARWSR